MWKNNLNEITFEDLKIQNLKIRKEIEYYSNSSLYQYIGKNSKEFLDYINII